MAKIPIGAKGYDITVTITSGRALMVIDHQEKTELCHVGCTGKSQLIIHSIKAYDRHAV
jgi:hypothetical protein